MPKRGRFDIPRRSRRVRRRRAVWGSKTRRLAFPRGARVPNLHHFKRVAQLTAINASSSGNVIGSLAFTFSQIPNNAEFTALFDQYRINKIKLQLIPNFTGSDLNPTSSVVALPNIWSVIDYDDNTSPANLNDLLQYPNVRMTRGQRIHTRYWTPAVGTDVGGVASASQKYKQWIDMSTTSIEHYGFKYFIDQLNTGPVGTWRVFATFYFSCKGVR